MAQHIYTVTFTTGLIDKLAGRKLPTREASTPPPVPRSILNPDLLALRQQDVQLDRALRTSKRVGNALLKAEQEDAAQVKELASSLLSQFNTTVKPLPCKQERQACLECYNTNKQNVLRCGPLVDAYAACAEKALKSVHA